MPFKSLQNISQLYNVDLYQIIPAPEGSPASASFRTLRSRPGAGTKHREPQNMASAKAPRRPRREKRAMGSFGISGWKLQLTAWKKDPKVTTNPAFSSTRMSAVEFTPGDNSRALSEWFGSRSIARAADLFSLGLGSTRKQTFDCVPRLQSVFPERYVLRLPFDSESSFLMCFT